MGQLRERRARPGGAILSGMEVSFTGEVVHWRGPSPYHFVRVPEEQSRALRDVAFVSYGWGVLPVTARLRHTEFTTSLFPKDGGYLVPLKDAVRRAEAVEIGDVVPLTLVVRGEV